jgi:hypothetical protein
MKNRKERNHLEGVIVKGRKIKQTLKWEHKNYLRLGQNKLQKQVL